MDGYDTITFCCLYCGREIRVQSKSGACSFRIFSYAAVPPSVAEGANLDAPFVCECGAKWRFDLSTLALPVILPIVEVQE